MATLDRLERLTDLVLVLLDARRPRTLDEIAVAVPGYPASHAARRQAFERDKRILRDEGIPVVTEPVEGPDQYGYRIDPDAFYLPDPGLEPDEQAALHLAVAGVELGDPSGRNALAKLGAWGVAEAHAVAQVDAPAALVPLFDAVRTQAEVRFSYRGAARIVAPATLQFRGGRWYLAGWDRERAAPRTYRVDRVDSRVAAGPPGSGTVPEGYTGGDVALDPWRDDEEAEQVLVRVDAVEGPRVAAEVGERAVVERTPEGSVLVQLGVSSFAVLRSWVLGLLDHAEVVGLPQSRAAVVSWLEEIAAGAPASQAGASARGAAGSAAAPTGTAADAAPVPRRAGARHPGGAASARLRRLLAIVAWLAEAGEVPIPELSSRFDMSPGEVVHELELAACCGIPPYTPDTLLEIVVSDETVRASLPKELARPRRLTPAEGLALAASARTILAVPGADRDGALARALGKLEALLGDDGRLVIRIDAPPLLDEVTALAAAGEQADIVYHSASTDETTERVVEPLEVLSVDGHWYLDAYCHRAEGVRRFRVDRIRRVRPAGRPVTARGGGHSGHAGDAGHSGHAGDAGHSGHGGEAGHSGHSGDAGHSGDRAFVPGPGAEKVTLELRGDARWVADSVPVLSREEGPGDAVRVVVAVGGRAWLERLLLQAGPRARVLAPPELGSVGREAATRLLRARYR